MKGGFVARPSDRQERNAAAFSIKNGAKIFARLSLWR
jgi:hypothetical protein